MGREVVNSLVPPVGQAQDLVGGIVEETPDACGADAGGFGFQIKHLTERR